MDLGAICLKATALHRRPQPLLRLGQGGGIGQYFKGLGGEVIGIHGLRRQPDHPRPTARGGLRVRINAIVEEAGVPIRPGLASSSGGAIGLIEGLLRDILGGATGDRPPPSNVSGSDR